MRAKSSNSIKKAILHFTNKNSRLPTKKEKLIIKNQVIMDRSLRLINSIKIKKIYRVMRKVHKFKNKAI